MSSQQSIIESQELLVDCNICGKNDFDVVFEANVAQKSRIVKCKNCALIYANPRWKPADVEQITAWDPNFDPIAQPWFKKRFDKEQIQVRDYENSRREMAAIFPERGKLLEIGFSMGFGLKAWQKDGWEVWGVEPWQLGTKYAKEQLQLPNVSAQTLAQAAFPNESFDVVVLLHVIEHLDDPKAELKEICRLLKPGGRFIVETPRYDSLMFKMLGRRERSVSCDGHIYFFTADTLSKLGREVGLETEKVRSVGRSLTLHRLLWNVGVMSKSKRLEKSLDNGSRMLHLDRLPLRLNVGDMQRITFKKPA
jgi:2-polyprenyl-3-methyl-5-hydroxy-6-metoxy-1,4-benzoquinol methylase